MSVNISNIPDSPSEARRAVDKLWFQVREANMDHSTVDTVVALQRVVDEMEDVEKERAEHYDEVEMLERDIDKLEAENKRLKELLEETRERLATMLEALEADA